MGTINIWWALARLFAKTCILTTCAKSGCFWDTWDRVVKRGSSYKSGGSRFWGVQIWGWGLGMGSIIGGWSYDHVYNRSRKADDFALCTINTCSGMDQKGSLFGVFGTLLGPIIGGYLTVPSYVLASPLWFCICAQSGSVREGVRNGVPGTVLGPFLVPIIRSGPISRQSILYGNPRLTRDLGGPVLNTFFKTGDKKGVIFSWFLVISPRNPRGSCKSGGLNFGPFLGPPDHFPDPLYMCT